jgi:predicted O-methyltransferase YrrM
MLDSDVLPPGQPGRGRRTGPPVPDAPAGATEDAVTGPPADEPSGAEPQAPDVVLPGAVVPGGSPPSTPGQPNQPGATTQQPATEPAPRSRPAEPSGTALTGWITSWQPEDAPLLAARQRAREVGVGAVDEVTGAALRMLAAVCGARHAVELGTGAGVSTLWLLRGLHPDGVLTSIDAEPEHQRLAKASLTEAGIHHPRVRLIAGRALAVLPRLSDGAYDLVLCDASSAEAVDYLPAALRLLRLGGVLVVAGALAGGRIADPSARDPETLAARELARAVREEPRLVPALLPVGTGLLVAVKQDAPA